MTDQELAQKHLKVLLKDVHDIMYDTTSYLNDATKESRKVLALDGLRCLKDAIDFFENKINQNSI